MKPERKNCPMRHENGNCQPIGGFCTANNDAICEGLHNAYDMGWMNAARRAVRIMDSELPPNLPLTLEELREMDGDAVWCCNPEDILQGHMAIVHNDPFDGPEYNQCAYAVGICWSFSDYGKTWVAYRRRPEGG